MPIQTRIFRTLAPAALALLGLAVAAAPAVAQDPCDIHGNIIAEPNAAEPDMGAWLYRLVVNWNTGVQYALSHIDLIMDDPQGRCTCEEVGAALRWHDPIGFSMESPTYCLVFYAPEFLCEGDPSIDVPGIMLKFEPYEDESCEPGTGGVATFTFYSDYPPGNIAEPNLFLVDKHGQLSCDGPVEGQFPMLPCDPVRTEPTSWGALRSLYR